MKPQTAIDIVRSGQVPLFMAMEKLSDPIYRASFLTGAARSGVLAELRSGPQPLNVLVERLGLPADASEALEIWLSIGVRLKEISKSSRGYGLDGWWAKRLADPKHDTIAAAVEEIVRFHHDVIMNAPLMLKDGRRLSLADQDGELIARATRVLEPFVREAIDLHVPAKGKLRLLEVGCGEGAYVRYAAERNPDLTAVAVDLQPEVADRAAGNISAWGLGDRVRVLAGDVRKTDCGTGFDVVTLHNLIYYFRFEERTALLEHLRSLLAPGGKLLLTTGCAGGNLQLDVISLWFAASDLGGRLPSVDEMISQMGAAGFSKPSAKGLIPGGAYYAFSGVNGAA